MKPLITQRTIDGIREDKCFWTGAACAGLLTFLWPGDIPFINDEALLIENALNANDDGRLAPRGLMGTAGVHYGPIPTWFYQACLLATDDLIIIGIIKNAITFVTLLVAMYGIGVRLGYARHPVLLIFVSPYLYLYGRQLWDNCFLIPCSAVLIFLFVNWLTSRRFLDLALSATVIVVMIHIHLTSIFLVIAFVGTLVIAERSWLREHRYRIVVTATMVAFLCAPYGFDVLRTAAVAGGHQAQFGANLPEVVGGVVYFSFIKWPERYLPELHSNSFPLPNGVTTILIALSMLSFVFYLVGLVIGIRTLIQNSRLRQRFTIEDKLTILCLMAIGVNFLFFSLTGRWHFSHYLGSVWFAYFFFLWRFVHIARLRNRWIAAYLSYAAAMIILLISVVYFIHVNGGSRRYTYGATLANQIRVTEAIVRFAPEARPVVNVENYRLFPHALDVLLRLAKRRLGDVGRPPSETPAIVIDYVPHRGSTSGWIEARVVGNDVPLE